jgi:hypothetical protein
MTDPDGVSIHSQQDIPAAPSGWVGGDLVHTGGNIYVREWIHPDAELRVGYSVNEPEKVAVEDVELVDEGEKENPLNWRFVSTREEISCDGEADCLDTAIDAMAQTDL